MTDILKAINSLGSRQCIGPVAEERIAEAQRELGVKFSDEYIEYVRRYGAISARGIELTGVVDCARISVVSVTKKEKSLNPNFPYNMYVVENIGIGGLLVLQDEDGMIYSFMPNEKLLLICDSLQKYIERKTQFFAGK